MKKFLVLALLLAHPIFDFSTAHAAKAKTKGKAEKKVKVKKIQDVVCFKLKEDATEAQIKEVESVFAALRDKIPGIDRLEWETNNSPEGLNSGRTVVTGQ